MSIPVWVPSTPLVLATAVSSKNKLTYNSTPSIALNDPSDPVNSTYQVEEIAMSPAWDRIVEPFPDRDGMHIGAPRALQAVITINGWVKGSSLSDLYDKIDAINAAFNPVRAYLSDTSVFDRGALALDFNVATTDTDNYATGLIASRYYAAPMNIPVPLNTKFDGLAARFSISLRCSDPRRYLQTTTTVVASANGTKVCDNSLASYPSWPIFEIVFSTTAPTADMTISSDQSDEVITLDYTKLAASKTLIVDTQAATAEYSDGTDKIGAIKAGSSFFMMFEGSNTLTFANFPTGFSINIIWRRAFV